MKAASFIGYAVFIALLFAVSATLYGMIIEDLTAMATCCGRGAI